MGFEDVYHLQGGILKYLEERPQQGSNWEGLCYVFDERAAVDHSLTPHPEVEFCDVCGHKLTTKDRVKPEHVPGVKCCYCPDQD